VTTIPLATFEDMFPGPTLDPRWDSSYGAVSISGGRGRIPCEVGSWAALGAVNAAPGDLWTIHESSLSLELVTLPTGGGAGVAYLLIGAMSGTAGTYLAVLCDVVGGYLALTSRVGYADPGAVYLAYDPVAHRWLRIRDTAGSVHWETSPDGVTWTIRRTLTPSPGWVSGAVQVLIESSRDGGANDAALIDNFNITPVSVLTGQPPLVAPITGPPPVGVFGTLLTTSPPLVVVGSTTSPSALLTTQAPLVSGSAVTHGLGGVATVRDLSGAAIIL
jgi:hypothetical protein